MNVLANYTGYWIGIGIEGFVIVVCTVLLILMLTGVLFAWIEKGKERSEANKEKREEEKTRREEEKARKEAERAAREAEREARVAEAAAKAQAEAAARAEAAAAEAEEEEEVKEEPKPQPKAEAKPEAKAESKATSANDTKTEEETVIEETETKKIKKKVTKVEEITEEETEEVTEDDDGNGGMSFGESKTITELYDELSAEQKGYFDELREEALTKPNAELSISRNFVTVKIGKRNLIKLLIKRGVTVAEFILENEQIKQLRLSERNKRGKSAIKVKPTTVQVIDLQSLKVAIDMITLAYEELMLDS